MGFEDDWRRSGVSDIFNRTLTCCVTLEQPYPLSVLMVSLRAAAGSLSLAPVQVLHVLAYVSVL